MFLHFIPIQESMVCKRVEHLYAWWHMLHSNWFNYATWLLSEKKTNQPFECKCKSKPFDNMLLLAALFWYATWPYSEKTIFICLFFGPRGRMWKKYIFLIWSSGGPFVQRSGTICVILVKGIIRNNSVKLFWIWTSGSRENVIKRHYLSKALTAPLFKWAKPFVQFW